MEPDKLNSEVARSILGKESDRLGLDIVRTTPFWDPSQQTQKAAWNRPDEAGRKTWLKGKEFWLTELVVLVLVNVTLLWFRFESQRIRDLIRNRGLLPHSWGFAALALGASILAFLLVALLFWWYKIPVHDPDPLFGRLLQAKVKSPSPLSASFIADLVGDVRFQDLFRRVVDHTLPESPAIPMPGQEEQDAALDHLAEALSDDTTFAQLYGDRRGLVDDTVRDHIRYVARTLLFDGILNHPDFFYIYGDILQKRQWITKWFSKIPWDKAKELFGKHDEHSSSKATGASVLTVANVLILGIIVVGTVVQKWNEDSKSRNSPDCHDCCEKCDKQASEVRRLAEQFAAAIQSLASAIGEPKEPAPVHVMLQSGAPIINPPTISIPPSQLNFPSKIDVTIASTKDTPCDKCPPPLGKKEGDGDHGQQGTTPPAQTPPAQTPPAQTPAKDVFGDDLLSFTPNDEEKGKDLVLHKRAPCFYHAALTSYNPWPPDPVAITLTETKNDDRCPKLDASTITAYATRNGVYSASLGAFLTIEEERTKHLWFGRDLLLIRIHPEEAPLISSSAGAQQKKP